ncbi:MAG: pilus assembly protein TadG-related protein [Verrucomicrobiia bacterium]
MKTATPTSGSPRRVPGRRGQTLIFMMMIMIILTFVAFSVYDTQHVVVQRVRSQNSSDSAALMGARWQLSSLNAIGEINLMKVTTEIVTSGPPPFSGGVSVEQYQSLFSALDKLQARIYFVGPMLGVLHAQQAAKLNGMHAVASYANTFYDLAQYIETHAGDYPDYVYNPWLQFFDSNERQQLLMDYAALCREIGDQGVAALPANAWGDDGDLDWSNATAYAQQFLGDRAFYGAIACQDWCYLKPLLWIYSDWTFWGPVTSSMGVDPFRFLSLRVRPRSDASLWNGLTSADQNNLNSIIQSMLTDPSRNLTPNENWPGGDNWPLHGFHWTNNLPRFDLPSAPAYVPLRWAVYNRGWYNQWDTALVGQLLAGTVKPSCNYSSRNADSVWVSQASANVTMAVANPDRTSWTAAGRQTELSDALNNLSALRNANSVSGRGILASAAARPFGQIDENTPPTQYPVVLPVFTDVRLIPLVFSSSGGDFDPAWLEHKFMHIPPYTHQGLSGLQAGCVYCQQLRVWENPGFRQIGIAWWNSQTNANPCPPGGGNQGGIVAH